MRRLSIFMISFAFFIILKDRVSATERAQKFHQEIEILNRSQGENLASMKRQAILRLSESDDIDALKILHQFHFRWTRNPETMKGLTAQEMKDLRYFSGQILKMKNSSDRLAGTTEENNLH